MVLVDLFKNFPTYYQCMKYRFKWKNYSFFLATLEEQDPGKIHFFEFQAFFLLFSFKLKNDGERIYRIMCHTSGDFEFLHK
ncbi:hypothetical protein AVEN_68424-1, partial [Araneus ventricosus]